MIVTRKQPIRFMFVLCVSFLMALAGCGGGSSSSTPSTPISPTPVLNVTPSGLIDFGIITDGNTATPRKVEIQNNGTANLNVATIGLSGTDMDSFYIELEGPPPCLTTSPTIAPGDSCSVKVGFDPALFGTYEKAALVIESDDPTTTVFNLALKGVFKKLEEIKVSISEPVFCPREQASVYVSVLDDQNFPIRNLPSGHFTIEELPGGSITIADFKFFPETAISVSLLMDYSFSILRDGNVQDMEAAAIAFVDKMNGDDQAEVIKYGTEVQQMIEFTSDKNALKEAIETLPEFERTTAFYDAIVLAIENIKVSTNDRKAIIAMTDGKDNASVVDDHLDVIALAQQNNIPIYTVGLGETDPQILQELADETGGVYFQTLDPGKLIQIYEQLADLLFENQYKLTFQSSINLGSAGTFSVTVNQCLQL